MRVVSKIKYEKEVTCPECGGTGYDPMDGGQCDRCGGEGTIEED